MKVLFVAFIAVLCWTCKVRLDESALTAQKSEWIPNPTMAPYSCMYDNDHFSFKISDLKFDTQSLRYEYTYEEIPKKKGRVAKAKHRGYFNETIRKDTATYTERGSLLYVFFEKGVFSRVELRLGRNELCQVDKST